MIGLSSSGSFKHMESFLSNLKKGLYSDLETYGRMGVSALARATPTESGLTARSWAYKVKRSVDSASIEWTNTNIHNGENVAILLQYGHGTGTGGYVAGRDYINPAIQPIFDQIADEVWKKVTNA